MVKVVPWNPDLRNAVWLHTLLGQRIAGQDL